MVNYSNIQQPSDFILCLCRLPQDPIYVHICKYDAEHTFKLLNSHEKELTLDKSVEILKQNAL
jgi:hypothetical protein